MSVGVRGQASILDPHRLSVRSNPSARPNRAQPGESAEPWVDITDVPMAEEPVVRAVEEGDTRRIRTVGEAIARLEEYVSIRDGQVLTLTRQTEDGPEVLNLPYNHRWTDDYRDMMYARLKAAERALLRKYQDPLPTTMLTLTVRQTDENGEPLPYATVLDNLKESWGKFRKAINRAIPDGMDYDYLRMVEPHKTGYPHVHVALFGVHLPSLAGKVEDLWVEKYNAGESWAQDVTAVQGRSAQMVQSPAAYCMKYLGKTTARADGTMQTAESFKAFAAALWVTETRQLSMSDWLSQAASREYETGSDKPPWQFRGVRTGYAAGFFDGEVAVEFIEHLESTVWKPPPPEVRPSDGPGEQSRLAA